MLTVKFRGEVGGRDYRIRLPRWYDPKAISRITVIDGMPPLQDESLTHFSIERVEDRYRITVVTEPQPYYRDPRGRYFPSQREPDGQPASGESFGFLRYMWTPRLLAQVNVTIDQCLEPNFDFIAALNRAQGLDRRGRDRSGRYRMALSPAPFGTNGFTLLPPVVLYDLRTRAYRDAPANPIDEHYGSILGYARDGLQPMLAVHRGTAHIEFD